MHPFWVYLAEIAVSTALVFGLNEWARRRREKSACSVWMKSEPGDHLG